MKRLFDLVISSVLLVIVSPFIGIIALLIKLDSPGPILYTTPKVGKDSRIFGMFRFRTVDVGKPNYLHVNERLTRVGRFIREWSLDDLPNLLNVLTGDLSVIGPRPTEPERVNRQDPTWQQILTVKPGMISPAILTLGHRYNSSPLSMKQQLELAYIQNQSFQHDLDLLWQGLRGYVISKGNWKARGNPSVAVEYTTYQPETPLSTTAEQLHTEPSAWNVVDWHDPDLSFIARFVYEHDRGWEHYVPQLRMVPCGGSEQKPALFLKVAHGYEQWASNIVLQDIRWTVVANSRYLCLGCTLFFEDVTGASFGVKAVNESKMLAEKTHRLVCSAILDVASPEVESWFSAWQQIAGDIPLFVVSNDHAKVHHRSFAIHNQKPSSFEFKAQAMQQWQTAKTRLQLSNHALENFRTEQEILFRTLPHKAQWETVEVALRTNWY